MVAAILIAVHLILSFGLIGLILLHAGRGGGLSDAFGGGMGPLGGLGGSTVAERNLDPSAVFEVLDESDRVLASVEVGFGEAQLLTADVTGVLRLKLKTSTGPNDDTTTIVWGTPTALGE